MKDEIQQASKAMAHIHVFAGIVGMLESGVICGGGTADTTSLKIIALCKRENQRQLKIHDRAIEAAHNIKEGT